MIGATENAGPAKCRTIKMTEAGKCKADIRGKILGDQATSSF